MLLVSAWNLYAICFERIALRASNAYINFNYFRQILTYSDNWISNSFWQWAGNIYGWIVHTDIISSSPCLLNHLTVFPMLERLNASQYQGSTQSLFKTNLTQYCLSQLISIWIQVDHGSRKLACSLARTAADGLCQPRAAMRLNMHARRMLDVERIIDSRRLFRLNSVCKLEM
jgi:hypothetical protein